MFGKIILSSALLFAPLVEDVSTNETPTTENTTFEDLDNDNIPDVIEDYYNEHIRDQYMFGITLGSLIGLATSIVSLIIFIHKTTKSSKLIKQTNENNQKTIEEMKLAIEEKNKINEEYRAQLNSIVEENKNLVKQNTEITNANIKKIDDCVKTLSSYSNFDKKLDASLNVLNILGSTENMIKEGKREQIVACLESVKQNGKEKQS